MALHACSIDRSSLRTWHVSTYASRSSASRRSIGVVNANTGMCVQTHICMSQLAFHVRVYCKSIDTWGASGPRTHEAPRGRIRFHNVSTNQASCRQWNCLSLDRYVDKVALNHAMSGRVARWLQLYTYTNIYVNIHTHVHTQEATRVAAPRSYVAIARTGKHTRVTCSRCDFLFKNMRGCLVKP